MCTPNPQPVHCFKLCLWIKQALQVPMAFLVSRFDTSRLLVKWRYLKSWVYLSGSSNLSKLKYSIYWEMSCHLYILTCCTLQLLYLWLACNVLSPLMRVIWNTYCCDKWFRVGILFVIGISFLCNVYTFFFSFSVLKKFLVTKWC